MKFSLINGDRKEAAKGLIGSCPNCLMETIAKCGDVKVWHWAHKGKKTCDSWWERETVWHRSWKSLYPVEWQEVVHHSELGEKHIADVKTNLGWVVEIQHSYLDQSERKSREDFYKKIIWIVDGKRRKRDYQNFVDAINNAIIVSNTPLFIRKISDHNCALIGDWEQSDAPVFFDFGDCIRSGDCEIEIVWWLLPKGYQGKRKYLMLETKKSLVQRLRDDESRSKDFEAILNEFACLMRERDEVEKKNREVMERRRSRYWL